MTHTKFTTVRKFSRSSAELQGSCRIGVLLVVFLHELGGSLFLKGDWRSTNCWLQNYEWFGKRVLIATYKSIRRNLGRLVGYLSNTINAWNGLSFAKVLSLVTFRSTLYRSGLARIPSA